MGVRGFCCIHVCRHTMSVWVFLPLHFICGGVPAVRLHLWESSYSYITSVQVFLMLCCICGAVPNCYTASVGVFLLLHASVGVFLP